MKEKIITNEFNEVKNCVNPILTQSGFSLVDIDILHDNDITVTLYVLNKDRDIESLSKLNHVIYDALEKINFLKSGFMLEISSPGISRKFKFHHEFSLFTGSTVKIMTNDGILHSGTIVSYENETVLLKKDNEILSLHIDMIKKAGLNG